MHHHPSGRAGCACLALWFSLTACGSNVLVSTERKDEKSAFLMGWIEAAAALFGPNAPPITMDSAVRAAKRAVARAALQLDDGNVQRAAERLNTSRKTIYRAASDNSIPRAIGLWEGVGVAALDSSLFPFLRVRWPSNADAAFTNGWADWWIGEVIPRAASENTLILCLHDFSEATSLPSTEMLSVLMARNSEVTTPSLPYLIGTVVFSPQLPLGSFLAPVINVVPFKVKLATTPAKAINLVTSAFEDAGVPVPTVTLD